MLALLRAVRRRGARGRAGHARGRGRRDRRPRACGSRPGGSWNDAAGRACARRCGGFAARRGAQRWWPRSAMAAAAAMLGTAVDGRLRPGHRLRPRGGARRPARRDRALHAASRSALVDARVARCRTCARAPTAASSPSVPLAADGNVSRRRRGADRRPGAGAATRSSPGATSARAAARSWSSAAWRASGTCASATSIDVGRRPAARSVGMAVVARQRRLPAGQRAARVRERRRARPGLHGARRARTSR